MHRLIYLSKAEIILRGMLLGLDYSMTVSCYQADEAGLRAGCVIPADCAERGLNRPVTRRDRHRTEWSSIYQVYLTNSPQ